MPFAGILFVDDVEADFETFNLYWNKDGRAWLAFGTLKDDVGGHVLRNDRDLIPKQVTTLWNVAKARKGAKGLTVTLLW